MKKNKNLKQDISIVELKKDFQRIEEKIDKIETQVYNHLPSKIDCLEKKIVNYKNTTQNWIISILVTLIFLLLTTLLNLLK